MFRTLLAAARSCTAGKQCLAMCALGLAASVMHGRWFEPARAAVERVLVPGQQALAPPAQAASELIESASQLWHNATHMSRLEARLGELEKINRELRLQLRATAPTAPTSEPALASAGVEPLLHSSLVAARVLGRQARGYLARRELLDAGSVAGARRDALVLDGTPSEPLLLDAGQDLGLTPHERVLAEAGGVQVVWGKLVDVGRLTSTLRRANDAGYRDLAQLAHVTADGLRWGARGVLEGQGERLCRLARVDLEAPVDIGDLVFAADNVGLDGQPTSSEPTQARLLYGSVVRIERPTAEAHWKIWIEPAISPEREPTQVAVVAMRLNPARIARTQSTPAARAGQPKNQR